MSYTLYYTTQCGRTTFRFHFVEEDGRWQAYIIDGPSFSAELVPRTECPPGCEQVNSLYRIRWFGMAQVASLQQAQVLAASWAEDIERFTVTGKWRIPYTTNDGGGYFLFSIERVGGGCRVYIEDQPSYERRSENTLIIHRLSDGSRRYICWAGGIPTWADAEDVATAWAERTRRYILTGKRFEESDA